MNLLAVRWMTAVGVLLIAGILAVAPLAAQGTRADYERAANLERETANRVFRQRVVPQWQPDHKSFWYRVAVGPAAYEFVWVDVVRGTRQLAADHPRLARALSQSLGRPVSAQQLPLDRLERPPGTSRLRFTAFARRWEWDAEMAELREIEAPAARADAEPSDLLKPLATERRSAASDEETSITIVNRRDDQIELLWVPPEGAERSYGRLAAGGSREQHTFAGHVWRLRDSRGRTVAMFAATSSPARAEVTPDLRPPVPGEGSRGRPRGRDEAPAGRSPDGSRRVVVENHNLVLLERPPVDGRTAGAERRIVLTRDGTESDAYAGPFHWSPDGRFLVAWQIRSVTPRQIHLIESSPRDQLQPKLHALDYPKPGDPRPQRRPRLFVPDEQRQVPLDDTLVANSWSVDHVRWQPDGREFTFVYHQRGHQLTQVLAVQAETGIPRVVIEERCPTFFDYAHKQYLHWLEATGEALWMSERSGWNHLYLYDTRSGQVKNAVTQGPWVVRGVERVDEQQRTVWLRISGQDPHQDPYHVHLARVGWDGSGWQVLTEGDGQHRWQFSPDGQTFLDTWSRVDLPPITVLRHSADGRLICELERADAAALLATGWRPPERFVAPGRDGKTDIHGIVIRPSWYDAPRRWPIIEQVYAGPQSAYVPKEWGLQLGPRQLAELGFVVVQIDGMGTSHRSKVFHDVCYRNLGDAGFPDRIAWIRALATRYPELDLSRVGIYGGSAGGQNAVRALLAHGDFYRVAVADCGCHDNRMDKIWWNELWMGWPVGPHYVEQSNVTQAHRLTGQLLLVVGELDRNVDPASTLQLADALIRADKDFELLLIPGAGHGAAESSYGRRRRQDFFTRHLLGVEPRHDR